MKREIYLHIFKIKSMKYTVFILFSSIFWCHLAFSQTHEFGGSLGLANYRGELAQVINLDSPGLYGNIFYRINFSKSLSFKASGGFAQIYDDDSKSKDVFAKARGHQFKTGILEFATQLEYNFLNFRSGGNRGLIQQWTPYAFVGLGVFKMVPVNNGQPTYSVFSGSIPLGIGFKAFLSDNWNMGVEFGPRFTFSDRLDDLGLEVNGQNNATLNPKYYTGNPNDKDMYFFTGVSISYVLPDLSERCPIKIPR
jgi:hypothetical protein